MYQQYFLVLSIAIITQTAIAQDTTIIFYNSQEIDKNRYEDIKGSPYLFEDWNYGTIVDNNGRSYKDVLLNYNGYTAEFEVKADDDKYIRLDERWYLQVMVKAGGETELLFRKNIYPKIAQKFVQILHIGRRVNLIKVFQVERAKNTVQNAGGTIEFKRFFPDSKYYVIIDNELEMVSSKKKKILEQFGHEKALQAYVKKEKLDLDSDEGLKAMIVFYEKKLLK